MVELSNVIKCVIGTEKNRMLLETQNKLILEVDLGATKSDIKQAISALFDVNPVRVNTFVTHDRKKRAFVTLPKDAIAMDIASKLGLM